MPSGASRPSQGLSLPGDEPKGVGISNRESARDKAEERRTHPPLNTGSPPPEDAAGRVGEQPLADIRDRHTSHKAGSRSIAQKEAASRYPDRSMPRPGRSPERSDGSQRANPHRCKTGSFAT